MARILILGIGNILWADEGFGVRCVEALAEGYELPPEVQAMDGGTQGLYLLPYLQEAEYLIVFDAVDYGLTPGTMKIVEDAEVPRFMGAKKMSLHQTGFQEVIAAAELTGQAPLHMLLVGVQPVELEDFGGSLRPAVKDCIPKALDVAIGKLAAWGVSLKPRLEAPAPSADVLSMAAYEAGRPSAEDACRIGDDRFFATQKEQA